MIFQRRISSEKQQNSKEKKKRTEKLIVSHPSAQFPLLFFLFVFFFLFVISEGTGGRGWWVKKNKKNKKKIKTRKRFVFLAPVYILENSVRKIRIISLYSITNGNVDKSATILDCATVCLVHSSLFFYI